MIASMNWEKLCNAVSMYVLHDTYILTYHAIQQHDQVLKYPKSMLVVAKNVCAALPSLTNREASSRDSNLGRGFCTPYGVQSAPYR